MALKDTMNKMNAMLCELCGDLEKAAEGNRAASQRVRTGSIKFAKMAKIYRKESIAAEKGGGGKRKAAKSKKAPAKKGKKKR